MSSLSLLGIDVGGTTVKARLVDMSGGTFGATLGEWRRPTPVGDHSGVATTKLIADLFALASSISLVSAMGIAVPGVVDENSGQCKHAVNLGWNDLPLRDMIARCVNVPLAFGQDVRAGALAEGTVGAAADHPGIWVFIPVGTGIAGALGRGGEIVPFHEWDGEIGQTLINSGRNAGLRVEQVASASAVARATGQPNAYAVAELVRARDPLANAVWDEAINVLAEALGGVVESTGADLIVVGGGLSESGTLLLAPLEATIRLRLPVGTPLALRRASLGDTSAVIGALIMAKRILVEA